MKARKHTNNIERIRQGYTTRLDKTRLGMNEYVPTMPEELFRKIIGGFSAEIASAYPEVNQAYDALAKFLSQPRDRILLMSGADMAVKTSLETFCELGDSVSTISPTFAMYGVYASLIGCKLEEKFCSNTGECLEVDLLSLAKPGTKAVILANPNGVTGFVFPLNSIRRLVSKAEQQNILIIVDETYVDFGSISTAPLIEEFSNLIIIRSFSKNIGMAGLRIGYILGSEPLVSMIEKFKPMVEINSLAVQAIKVICSDEKYLTNATNQIVNTRKNFAETMREMGFDCSERSGNFVLVDFGKNKESICQCLDKKKIEYKKLPAPLQHYIRITIGTDEIMSRVISILKTASSNIT